MKRRLTLRPARREESTDAAAWSVLVVDDDHDVHDMTRLLLRDLAFQGKGFEVVSAFSAAEARQVLAQRSDIPVALVDVVMETDDAGLVLIQDIRQRLNNHSIRIILRTGQPGEAPERDVVLAYDINDYKSKTELTAQKLFTAVVGALRSWEDIVAIQRLKATLEQRIEDRTRELAEAHRFAERLIETIPNPVWFKDGEGRYRLYNRAFRELFGIDEACWQGRTADDISCPGMVAADTGSDADLTAGRSKRIELEIAIEAPDGPRTLLLAKSALDTEDGQVAGIIGVLTDISDRKRLECELQRLATTDSLTGCCNRRQFFALANHELERSLRFNHPLSLVALDIDRFKLINDTYGHGVGDEALKAVVQACRATLRDIDTLGRLGGEEFAVLLPETDLAGAADAAERLRAAVAAAVVEGAPAEIQLTASFGVARLPPGPGTLQGMLAAADDALYRAKHEGRDRVVVAK